MGQKNNNNSLLWPVGASNHCLYWFQTCNTRQTARTKHTPRSKYSSAFPEKHVGRSRSAHHVSASHHQMRSVRANNVGPKCCPSHPSHNRKACSYRHQQELALPPPPPPYHACGRPRRAPGTTPNSAADHQSRAPMASPKTFRTNHFGVDKGGTKD